MIDTVEIVVQAGNGGDGFLAFRREKFVARGGPEGGDGGDGGSIYLLATSDENTLQHLTYKRRQRAGHGLAGKRSNKHGKNGKDIIIRVPVGTIVSQALGDDEGVPPIDLAEDGMKVLIARGGIGGKGNAQYVTPTNQEPLLREAGEQGDTRQLFLEVKVLADVGVIGVPNAGKSSFVSRVTAAHPKIAAYPFTTLEPVLGVVDNRGETFVIAEIPGLVEGAHQGVGLGHEFLRHAERTRIFLHLLDGSGIDPIEDFKRVNEELRLYSADLAMRPQIVVINKTDIPEVRARLPELVSALNELGVEPLDISAATGDGIQVVLDRLLQGVEPAQEKRKPAKEKFVDGAPVRHRTGIVTILEDGTFEVRWSKAQRLVALVDTDDQRIVGQLFREFKRLGVIGALEMKGVKYGDPVRIGDWEFDWGDMIAPDMEW
ncbi:MAG: GTPase ObgE [Chloroflexi bacterium]|nr:GTPase ObgE [Chloroflexota bacterium]